MATAGRRDSVDLTARIHAEPYRFRFFQAIRLLKLTERSAGRKAAIPEKLRFRTPATLVFPSSEIARLGPSRPPHSGNRGPDLEMEVGFMGLTGPSGVLPHHYTEFLMERRFIHRDVSAHAFFDIFSHRAVFLLYEAWQKYRFHISYEMGERGGFTRHLLDLLGTGRPPLRGARGPDALSTRILAYFAGVLGRRPLPASCLQGVVASYFGVRTELEQYVGQWITAPAEEQSCLGGSCSALGVSTILGQRVWDQQTKIRLRLGPLDLATFTQFQPGKRASQALRQLVEICLGQSLNCDVMLVLRKEDVPDFALARDAKIQPCLGINTWIRTSDPAADPDDVRFRLL